MDDDINFDISDVNYLEHTFSATGFVRTYMPIGSSKIFGLFNEARVTYGYGQGKTLRVQIPIIPVLTRPSRICRSEWRRV